MIELTPVQVKGLKLASAGDLFPQEGNKWTHLNAEVTYLKRDRFRERPQAIKTISTATVKLLKSVGFLTSVNDSEEAPHSITMAGKIWLMTNK